WAVRRAEDRLGLAPVWTLAVAYPAVEFAYPLLFPYSIGASQYRFTAITQIVEVTGLLGLTALIGLVNGAVYELLDARLEGRRPGVRNVRDQVTRGIDRPMIWGALTYRPRPDGEADLFNTALLTTAAGEVVGSYDKTELLLFGERIPLVQTFPGIRRWFPHSS